MDGFLFTSLINQKENTSHTKQVLNLYSKVVFTAEKTDQLHEEQPVAFNDGWDSCVIKGAQGNLSFTFHGGNTGDLETPSPFPGFLQPSPSFCEGQ